MEQLIFVAIIVIFSILDSVARTKKKRQQAGALPKPKAPEEWEIEEDAEDSYDSEPSYDDVEVRRAPEEAEPLPRHVQPYGSAGGTKRTASKGSEGMIPTDIWEEIAGLAKGRAPAPPTPGPAPPEPVRTSASPPQRAPARRAGKTPSRSIGKPPSRPVEAHLVHRAHAGFGTDPSTRARSQQDGLDPLASPLGVDAASARRQLLSKDRHALRQAVILQEILGPPAALRQDPLGE